MGKARDRAAFLARNHDPEILFLLAADVAGDIDAPVPAAAKAEVVERDRKLHAPSLVADDMRGFPHAVPSVVVPTVVLDYSVVDRPAGIHRKVVARLVVVMRV